MNNIDKAVGHYREFCLALDIDISKADTRDTPRRVAKMFANEFTSGKREKDFNYLLPSLLRKDNLISW